MRAFVLAAVLSGCSGLFPDFPSIPEPGSKQQDAAAGAAAAPTIVLVPQVCRDACKTMQRLGCAGRMGSPGVDDVFGTGDEDSCEIVCSRIEKAAEEVPGWSLNPACIAKAKDCRQANDCVRVSSEFQ